MTNNEQQKKVTLPGYYDERVCVKELAGRISYSVRYVRAMVRDGFPMPGKRASANDAFGWLGDHPDFCVNKRRVGGK